MESNMGLYGRSINTTELSREAHMLAHKRCNPLRVAAGKSFAIILSGVLGFQAASVAAQQAPSAPTATPDIAKKFPDGPGKETFLRTCSACHSPTNVLASGQSRQGWEDTITKMAGYGATGTDEDFTAILEYLVQNFPAQEKVDINKASAAQLEKNLQLEPAVAEAIVFFRDKHGNFKSLDDVKKVPGVNTAALDAKKGLITFD